MGSDVGIASQIIRHKGGGSFAVQTSGPVFVARQAGLKP
jgi:hypothetical protein